MNPTHPDIFHATSTIDDGNMSCTYGGEDEVVANRKKFLTKWGLGLEDCVMMDLNHGVSVSVIEESDKGKAMDSCGIDGIQSDSFITSTPGVYLFLLTADCLPLTLYDPGKKVLALVHLSRMTTGGKLVQKTIEVMRNKWEVDAGDILVWGDPSISKSSYKLDFFTEGVDVWGDFVVKMPDGKVSVDVIGFNRKQLLDMGVKENNIDISDIDTFKSSTYFSHYRSSRTGEREGRFVTVAGIKT